MPSLTDQLPDSGNATRIIQPVQGVNVAAPLANLADGIFSSGENLYKFGLQQEDLHARNDAAQAQFDAEQSVHNNLQQAQGNPNPPAAPDPGLGIPSGLIQDANNGINNLQAVQSAQGQGRLPDGSLDMHADQVISSLYAKYPDAKATIAGYFQQSGFDHYLFRDVQAAQAQVQSQQSARLEAQAAQYKFATESLGVGSNVDYNIAAQIGAQGMAAKFAQDQASIQLNNAKTKSDIDQQTRTQLLDQGERNLNTSMTQEDGLKVGSIVSNFQTLLQGALLDKTGQKEKELEDMSPQLVNGLTQYKNGRIAAFHAAGGKDDSVISGYLDSQIKGLTDVFTGPLSQSSIKSQALKSITDGLGIDAANSLPLYTELSKTLGPQAIALMFSNDPVAGMSQQTKMDIKNEMLGFKQGSIDGQLTLDNVKQIVAGVKGIHQMSESDATKALPGVIATVKGEQQAYASNPGTANVGNWANGYSNATLAAGSIQPGTADTNSVNLATSVVTDPAVRPILSAMIKNPASASQGLAIAQASRDTSVKLLGILQSQDNSATSQNNFYSVQFNPKMGVYIPVQDKQAAANSVTAFSTLANTDPRLGNVGGNVRSGLVSNQVPTAVQSRVAAMNGALNHLVATAPYDDQTKSISGSVLRDHYANGTPLPATPGSSTNTDQQFERSRAQIQQQINDLPATSAAESQGSIRHSQQIATYEPMAVAAAQKYGVPTSFFTDLIGHESSWDPAADAHIHYPESHAFGLGQVQPGTATALGFKPEDRTDPAKNLDMSAKYLSQLAAQHGGDWIAAAKDYSGGTYTPGRISQLQRRLTGG